MLESRTLIIAALVVNDWEDLSASSLPCLS